MAAASIQFAVGDKYSRASAVTVIHVIGIVLRWATNVGDCYLLIGFNLHWSCYRVLDHLICYLKGVTFSTFGFILFTCSCL